MINNKNKSKPWQLSEWRKRRKEYLIGKSCNWCGSTKTLSIHHPQRKNSLTDETYFSFKGVKVLCKRCHYARHKGLHLCKLCKKKYVRSKYKHCYECFKKNLPVEEQSKFEAKLVEIIS